MHSFGVQHIVQPTETYVWGSVPPRNTPHIYAPAQKNTYCTQPANALAKQF